MDKMTARLRSLWRSEEQEYEQLSNSEITENGGEPVRSSRTTIAAATAAAAAARQNNGFSRVEYSIFLLLGVSMLWAWNMFLAAGPYFQHRFRSNPWIFENFQAAEVSVSTVTNLGSMLLLTRMQAGASYPKRIVTSLVLNMVAFSLLAVSTAVETSAEVYFGFLMVMMFLASLAAGFCQNGLFAYVSGFEERGYTQGIMTGQAVAGVLPCVAQIVSVASVHRPRREDNDDGDDDVVHGHPRGPPPVKWTAALAYFLTATAISILTLFAFSILLARNNRPAKKILHSDDGATVPDDLGRSTDALNPNAYDGDHDDDDDDDDDDVNTPSKKPVSLVRLASKLRWLAAGVFLTFAITMTFPVFTQRIPSVHPPADGGLPPPIFIPLALLFWNSGDLTGRLLTAAPSLSLARRPRVVFTLAVSRLVFVGLYHLCNLRGRGAIVESDVFYLVVVQLFFGLSNGFLGSTCMMGAGEWVEREEREAAGGFMGLCLVGGLTAGSLLSFVVAQ